MQFNSEFSSDIFKSSGIDSQSSERLASKLQDQIAREIQGEVIELGRKIKASLNSLGHDLTLLDSEMDSGRVSVTFADKSAGVGREKHKLRFDLDLIVSVGYPGYADE